MDAESDVYFRYSQQYTGAQVELIVYSRQFSRGRVMYLNLYFSLGTFYVVLGVDLMVRHYTTVRETGAREGHSITEGISIGYHEYTYDGTKAGS